MNVSTATVAPVMPNVVITLTHDEAMKLRRVCYYNKTISQKFAGNPSGGRTKASAIDIFLNDLGNSLKRKNVERF